MFDFSRFTVNDFCTFADPDASVMAKFAVVGRVYERGPAAFDALPFIDALRMFAQFGVALNARVADVQEDINASATRVDGDQLAELMRRINKQQ